MPYAGNIVEGSLILHLFPSALNFFLIMGGEKKDDMINRRRTLTHHNRYPLCGVDGITPGYNGSNSVVENRLVTSSTLVGGI